MSSPPSGAASSSPGAGRITSRDLSFRNVLGEKLVGTIDSIVGDAADPDVNAPASSNSNSCALVCHGMLSNRNEFFLPSLSTALLRHCSSRVQHVYRFDFSGSGGSEGTFEYGGYDKMTSEIMSCVDMLRREHGMRVTHLLGHSMAASAALLYASRNASIPHVVAIAPRYDMMSDFRFSKEDLLKLVRDGVMSLRVRGRPDPVPVSLDTYRERLRLDMSCVRHIGRGKEEEGGDKRAGDIKPVHTLLLHGSLDEVIPLSDARHLHQWMVAAKPLEGTGASDDDMDQAARDCTCVINDPAALATQGTEAAAASLAVSAGSFTPALSSSMSHTLVALPGANHCFTKPAGASDLLCQTVCAWVSLHGRECEGVCDPPQLDQPLPEDQYATRVRRQTNTTHDASSSSSSAPGDKQ